VFGAEKRMEFMALSIIVVETACLLQAAGEVRWF
jgi:hypothetical protein